MIFVAVTVTGEGVTVTVVVREQPVTNTGNKITVRNNEQILSILIPLELNTITESKLVLKYYLIISLIYAG